MSRKKPRGFGQNKRGVELKLTSQGHEALHIPQHLKENLDSRFSYMVPVVATCGTEAVRGAVLFGYRENRDKAGIDDFTGTRHNEDFHVTSKLASFDWADWLNPKPKSNRANEISLLVSEVAKAAVLLMEGEKCR